ncbi:hypothetical protein [Deinococcus hopiensis]|uniref:Uncharacterized protein n=1 Tax=Deinococcus hopiensis KR-140 TaxID=695939 RepID=A0A1W1UDL9_9DEIO|nr:hypothetical protein [Deinococcus hopiensis]SMB79122.1 hypothetical protein SAMN00790413_05775 [Deinococcus hopiensis KR-140]
MKVRDIEAFVSIERRYDLTTHEIANSFISLYVKYSHMFPILFEPFMPDGLDELQQELENLSVGSTYSFNYDVFRRTSEDVLDLFSAGPYFDREDNLERYRFIDVMQLISDVRRCVEKLLVLNPDCDYQALTRSSI